MSPDSIDHSFGGYSVTGGAGLGWDLNVMRTRIISEMANFLGYLIAVRRILELPGGKNDVSSGKYYWSMGKKANLWKMARIPKNDP